MDLTQFLVEIALLILAPIAVGLSTGIDRRITARMQNRVGPPLLQPFYDLFKLFSKQRLALNSHQVLFAAASMVLQAAALALFIAGGDLLIIFFVSGFGSVAAVLGAFSACSPYSYFGTQRELLQIIAYEPVLFLTILAIGFTSGSFLIDAIDHSLLLVLPLAFIAMVTVLLIRLQKSPFDIASAHQEVISGPQVEFAGPYLGLLKLSHWFELAIVYGIITLFFFHENLFISAAGKLALAFASLFVVILIDNTTARLTRKSLIKFNPLFGTLLIALNLLIIFILDQGVMG